MSILSNDFWPIKITNDVIVCVQPTLNQMSSYILLEQEDWFEDEMDFVREYIQPDMYALDIGANHGVYALSIAKKLRTGHVWAFEPTLEPRSKLAKSIELNGFGDNVTLVDAGLSDCAKTALISTSTNSELNSLYGKGENKELIKLEALDEYLLSACPNQIFSFVKLDAEGEELNVLKGGSKFFGEQSPLIMFELKHGNAVNYKLIDAVRSYGYAIYRLLPNINILIEYQDSFSDGYLLNLFACKLDRSQSLSEMGLLASSAQIKQALETNFSFSLDWAERLAKFPYAQLCMSVWSGKLPEIPQPYIAALSASLRVYEKNISASHRVALLIIANNTLDKMEENSQCKSIPEWLLKIHIMHLLGFRSVAINLAAQIASRYSDNIVPDWPFVPPTKDFFERVPTQNISAWLQNALLEYFEIRKAFSSYFLSDPLPAISSLLKNPNHGIALDRRALLIAKRTQRPVRIPSDHRLFDKELSVNAMIWRSICSCDLKQPESKAKS